MNLRLRRLTLSALIIAASVCLSASLLAASIDFNLSTSAWESATLSIDNAAKKIREQTGGKILASKQIKKGDRTYYQFKVLLPNGEVKLIIVDPEKG